MTIKATFTSKDNSRADDTTTYWFDINGETYGVVHSGESWNSQVVDSDGVPSTDYTVEQFVITDEMIAE